LEEQWCRSLLICDQFPVQLPDYLATRDASTSTLADDGSKSFRQSRQVSDLMFDGVEVLSRNGINLVTAAIILSSSSSGRELRRE